MLNLAANLNFLYQEVPFFNRFEAAARDGFRGVEILFPYEWNAKEIAKRLNSTGLKQVLFNLHPGRWSEGERGLASLPGREAEFMNSMRQALDYAGELGCQQLHIMAGLRDPDLSYAQQKGTFTDSLSKALDLAKADDVTVLIEPINTEDIPGYFLNNFADAAEIIGEIGSDRLKLQFDIYHCQKIHGRLTRHLTDLLPITGHIQIANPPSRSEPSLGEINYSYLFNMLEAKGFSDWIGCEYKPSATTTETLGWASDYLRKP